MAVLKEFIMINELEGVALTLVADGKGFSQLTKPFTP